MKAQDQITGHGEPDDEQTAEDTINALRSDSATNFVINIDYDETEIQEPKVQL